MTKHMLPVTIQYPHERIQGEAPLSRLEDYERGMELLEAGYWFLASPLSNGDEVALSVETDDELIDFEVCENTAPSVETTFLRLLNRVYLMLKGLSI